MFFLCSFLMADNTQASRDTSSGLGSADNTVRSEGIAVDGVQGPEADTVEAGVP